MIIKYPQDKELLLKAKAGTIIEFSGTLFTARDAAHMRLNDLVNNGKDIPVDFTDSFIYYAGPTPTPPGKIVGSIGPTTSSRMDSYLELMTSLNVVGTIGKGPRSKDCEEYYKKHHILYFVTTGGCGALLSKSVKKAEEIAFFDLGPESIKRLEVENFKMILAIDYNGNSIFGGK